jgi:hypothetical protein
MNVTTTVRLLSEAPIHVWSWPDGYMIHFDGLTESRWKYSVKRGIANPPSFRTLAQFTNNVDAMACLEAWQAGPFSKEEVDREKYKCKEPEVHPAMHLHARGHHRVECQCLDCSSCMGEPCSETNPCSLCRRSKGE